VALCAASVASSSGLCRISETAASNEPDKVHDDLTTRRELLIRGAYVMTMDSKFGDIPGGDVHVRNGVITAVGKGLQAPGATVLNGRGMIVLPGLVETHWHMWNTLLRSFSGDITKELYFPNILEFGRNFTPEDIYQGTRLGAAEALHAGITTVHDWAHNLRSPAHAEAELRALRDVGIRARFSYSWYQGMPVTETFDLTDIERLHRNWSSYSNGGLIHLGMGWRGMYSFGNVPEEVYRKEFETARRLAIPVAVHLSNKRTVPPNGTVEMHAKAGFIGKGVLVAHCTWVTPNEIRILADTGAAASLSPITDARVGYGFAPASELIASGVSCCLSIDTTALTGSCSLFENMKFLVCVENGKAELENKLVPRNVLEMGTIQGARALGIDDIVGSLKPGKRADLIMVSTRDVNIGVFTDPAHILVESTQEANVDTVIFDGRIVKRGGKFTSLSADTISGEASAALTDLRKRSNWR